MPKLSDPTPHFDVPALLQAVHQQDLGLRVTTNNPKGFLRIVYSCIRNEHPELRISIYADPIAPSSFYLLREPLSALPALEEPAHD